MPQSNIPGPNPLPLVGSRGNLIQFMMDPIGYMQKLHRNFGNIASMVRGQDRTMVFAFGPEHNQQILSDPALFLNAGITHAGPQNSANRRISYGLLSMNGEPHRQRRRILMPYFTPNIFPNYHGKIVAIVDEMLNRWSGRAAVDLLDEMKQLTKLISGAVFFGLEDPSKIYYLGGLLEKWREMNFSATRLFPIDLPGTPYRQMLKTAEKLEAEILEMIREKRAAMTAQPKDMFSGFIQAADQEGSGITSDELVGQANLLFGASYETTSNALAWTFFLLSQHPAASGDLLDELAPALRGGAPDLDQLNQLPLLERVIDESLRILPPAVYSCRITSDAVDLGPYRITKGTTVAFSHYVTHHMKEIFPEPEKFLPERWLNLSPTPFDYLPFGYGAHVCLGAAFAMMTMKIAISMILGRYRLRVIPNAKIDRAVAITLSAKHGMPMSIHAQDREFNKSKTTVRGNIHEMVDLLSLH